MDEKISIEASLVGFGEPNIYNDVQNNVPDLNKAKTSVENCDKCEELMEIFHSKDYQQFLEYRSKNGYFITK
jgi:hypothetical protein